MSAARIKIIAEAGVNHNGSLKLALQLVRIAAKAGVDAVKFQTFKAGNLATPNAPKADYQNQSESISESQYDMLRRLELSREDHIKIIESCQDLNIQFMSSAFDMESLSFLCKDLSLNQIKFGSGEITNAPLLYEAARSGCNIILSTGISSIDDIKDALGVLAYGMLSKSCEYPKSEDFREILSRTAAWDILKKRVSLLHCTSEYPAPYRDCNLLAIDVLRTTFGLEVGYSDHTEGTEICLAAAALGASIIEKHFTINRSLTGPDHAASIEGEELKSLVDGVRKIELALGSAAKSPQASELKNKQAIRKCIVADTTIKKGDTFSTGNLTIKRPDIGISPKYFFDLLGQKADRDYSKDEPITL